jgi:hypothetical protein
LYLLKLELRSWKRKQKDEPVSILYIYVRVGT